MTDQMTTTYFRCHEALERLDRYVGAWIVVTGGDSPGDLAIRHLKEGLETAINENHTLAQRVEHNIAAACEAVGVEGP